MKIKTTLSLFAMFMFVISFTSCQKKATTPAIETLGVMEITESSAKCGGSITENGGAFIKQRGVCWSSSSTLPTISDNKTTDGNGDGTFLTTIGGLDGNTTYYVRAYAKNEADVAYGETKEFTTDDYQMTYATVTTSDVTGITQTTATCGGNVTTDGNSLVTSCGVCWSTSPTPTISNSYTSDGRGLGNFTSSITGLTAGTKYYVRAYAKNSVGVVYGEEKSFTTNSSGGGGGGTITPLSDYIGTYSVSAYNWDDGTYESWSGTEISTYYNSSTSSTWIKVTGIVNGAGYDYFHAIGEYDATTGAIHLYGFWYLTNLTFYFTSTPGVYYYSVFCPVYALDSGTTFSYIADGNGYQDAPEMYLTKNANGTFTLTGADYNDSNGRKATGFCLNYYKVSDNTNAGRFNVYTHYTLTKTSKDVGSASKNFEPMKMVKVPYNIGNCIKVIDNKYSKNTLSYGR